jgi:hypothetical protein
VLPAGYRLALTVRGRDYEYPKAGGDRIATFKNELRGCGPFLHEPVFDGTVTIHSGRLLLPVIP